MWFLSRDFVKLIEYIDAVDVRELMENAVEELLSIAELPAQYCSKGGSADRGNREQLLT